MFLKGDRSATPDLSVLRVWHLESWAYGRLSSTHPLHSQCRSQFIKSRVRHELIKRDVISMVRAWNAAGIEPVLYKGFALAEFIYETPGKRFHGDVDFLVTPSEFDRALEVGRAMGYKTPEPVQHWAWHLREPNERVLRNAAENQEFDLHQRLVMTLLPWNARERALTQMAYERSTLVQWHGARIRLLNLADCFIFGLVISRCWGGDNWTLKSHDFLDACEFVEQGLTRDQLMERAAELKLSRTVTTFLKRCDPFGKILNLRPPSVLQIISLECHSAPEHVPLMFVNLALRLIRTLLAIVNLPRILPLYWEVRRALLADADLPAALSKLEASNSQWGRNRVDVVFYWWWARRLSKLEPMIWPVMSYLALRRRGAEPVFRLGELSGRQCAWVEIAGRALPEFYSAHRRLGKFKILLERC